VSKDCAVDAFPLRCPITVKDVTNGNFGILIAYVLPGLTALWGVSWHSETLRVWLGTSQLNSATVGGFLYITLASVGAGVITSTVRWMLVDRIHQWSGLPRPDFNYAELQRNLAGFDLMVRHHYQYYKFHSNFLVAIVFAYLARRASLGFWIQPLDWSGAAFAILTVVLFMGSRDNLRRYYEAVEMILGAKSPTKLVETGGREVSDGP